LDARFLYWSPSREIVNEIDLQMVADSFFPCHEHVPEPTRFFIQSARDIFMLMLARRPTAPTLVEWLRDEKKIDEIVAGTECAHKINKKAGPQRVAVLSTLSDAGRLLKVLPAREGDEPRLQSHGVGQATPGLDLHHVTAGRARRAEALAGRLPKHPHEALAERG
jgi:hypothetical protein